MKDTLATYCDGVFESDYRLIFSDGRVALKVLGVPPGETRWVLLESGTPAQGVGRVSSFSSHELSDVVVPGSRISFSGGSDEKPPSFSALLG